MNAEQFLKEHEAEALKKIAEAMGREYQTLWDDETGCYPEVTFFNPLTNAEQWVECSMWYRRKIHNLSDLKYFMACIGRANKSREALLIAILELIVEKQMSKLNTQQSVKETITVERKKLEVIKAFVSPYDTARQLLDAILNPTPTMTKADWQRVIDEGFYVRAFGDYPKIKLLPPICATLDGEEVSETYEVAREKGLRQIHIKGHPHPDGDDEVLVIFNDKTKYHGAASDGCISWDDVREYIVL